MINMADWRVDWRMAFHGSLIAGVMLCYVLLLLGIAWRADRHRFLPGRNVMRGVSYALSLSVLCTSWTYFGAVGLAMRSGWDFLPNSLGPIIALIVLWPIWRRVAAICKRENLSSIADFIASRYGKSKTLGALIASIAILGALPYLALQMMALSKAIAVILGKPSAPWEATFAIVLILAGLSILFGARRPTLTQHNRGLTQVVAFESLVKLIALVTVAGLAILLVTRADTPLRWGALGHWPVVNSGFAISTVLCAVTMFTLPRVFHLGFITFEEMNDLKVGRWLFPSYMALWALAIVPIAVAGATLGNADPDTVVLSIPLQWGGTSIASIAFLGGFSAGAAMVMVETIALSAMISNELILPLLSRAGWISPASTDVGALIVNVRRAAIVAILALSYGYFLDMSASANLPRLGFASLAASAQLFPALVGAVVWRRGHARGVFAGMSGGILIWAITIAAPQTSLRPAFVAFWGDVETLFNWGVCVSLALNTFLYITVSLRSRETLIDRIQANAFLAESDMASAARHLELHGTVGNLRKLLQRFLGSAETARGLADFGKSGGRPPDDDEPVTPAIARLAERMLAGAIGASSARNVIALALAGDERDASDVSHILDEAAHAVQFSREVVQTAFNALEQGISVVDSNLRLLAWNQRYIELFDYPASEVYIGKPLVELMEQSGLRATMSPSERQAAVKERVGAMQRREYQQYDREWPNGSIVRVVGRPLSSGEYVTSFTDVTEIRAASRALAQVAGDLELRVQERTKELLEVNRALASARSEAERVTAAQNRFVAAASHDLLQPMHATRLYIEAARDGLHGNDRVNQLLLNADMSVEAADRLLKALLNLSRIEVGGLAPDFRPVDLGSLLLDLKREFAPLAQGKGLGLHVSETSWWGWSNPDLLRSALQNLIGNALRYTQSGQVLICVRRDTAGARIEVRDSGPGIASEACEFIFQEFTRLPATKGSAGAGLGLSIAKRICLALDHRLAVRSRPGLGSVFSLALPLANPDTAALQPKALPSRLQGLEILCVEDEPDVLKALDALLTGWGARVATARDSMRAAELVGGGPVFDAMIVDYRLGVGMDGLHFLGDQQARAGAKLLLTADFSEEIRKKAGDMGIAVMRKPVSPAALRAFLDHAAINVASDSPH